MRTYNQEAIYLCTDDTLKPYQGNLPKDSDDIKKELAQITQDIKSGKYNKQ